MKINGVEYKLDKNFRYSKKYYILSKTNKINEESKYFFIDLKNIPFFYKKEHKYVITIKIPENKSLTSMKTSEILVEKVNVYCLYFNFVSEFISIIDIETIKEFVNRQTIDFLKKMVIKTDIVKYIKDEEILEELVEYNPYIIQYISKQTINLCQLAFQKQPKTIKYIKRNILRYISDDIDFYISRLVRKDGLIIKFIENQTEYLCLLALKSNKKSFKFMKNPTYEVCLEAVKLCGWNLKYIKNQTTELCILALLNKYEAIRYVYNKDKFINNVREILVKHNITIDK